MSNSFYHKEVTDEQWKQIKFLFPEPKKTGRPPLNSRVTFNAILWILASGARWRDLPTRYGNWNSIYHKFRQWCECGLFKRLLEEFSDGRASLLEMDSTFCKVHQSARSGLKNQAIGSSRGGKNTKIHVLLNERMHVLNVVLTGGHIHDSTVALDLLAGIDLAGKKVLADRAYSCDKIRSFLENHGAQVCIPDKKNFKVKHDFDAELYKQRNFVERFFQRVKSYRHIAFRFDKLADCFLNFVLLACLAIHF